MDVQVLNEIANQVRQASLTQVKPPVSANAQLKALKGNLVPVPGNPAPPPFEDAPEQTQNPVTPEISTVARAASAYSVAVGNGLNSDELAAIQDLAGKVRTAVSDFLSQPGLEQAENAAGVVASHPEAVQELTARVEQAVVETLNPPEISGEAIAHVDSPITDSLEEGLIPTNLISVERITRGAEPNSTVVAASPALVHARASENTSAANPVTVEEVVETQVGDFRVTPASPALENANPKSAVVENPVKNVNAPETSSGDFRVTASRPELPNTQAGENIPAETPVRRPQAIVAPLQEPVSRPETVADNTQEVPATAARPVVQNAQSDENVPVETSVRRPQAIGAPPQEPVSRPETVASNTQETPATAASPVVQNVQSDENVPVETPVNRPQTIEVPPQVPVSRPETGADNTQEVPVTAASPEAQNAEAGENIPAETPVRRPQAIVAPPQEPVSRPETGAAKPQEVPVTAASPVVPNAQTQNAELGNPVNVPALSVDQGQDSERGQAQAVINPEGATAPSEGTRGQTVSDQPNSQPASSPSNPQPASGPLPAPPSSNDLFAQGNASVNPENIRNANELVNSVVENEFTSEAKKIFSEPKVIRTVADLADFILERLREIIAANQLQRQSHSSGETGLL